jgi:hypothetical protein
VKGLRAVRAFFVNFLELSKPSNIYFIAF